MAGHHALNETRRWLVRPGAERRLLALLVASVLVVAGSLVLLHAETSTDRSEITEVRNSAGA